MKSAEDTGTSASPLRSIKESIVTWLAMWKFKRVFYAIPERIFFLRFCETPFETKAREKSNGPVSLPQRTWKMAWFESNYFIFSRCADENLQSPARIFILRFAIRT